MNAESNGIPEKMASLVKGFDSCRPAFTALGDENRQHIVLALMQSCGGMRVGELTKQTHLSRPAVSHHLKVLKDAGMVSVYKKGTMNFYHIDANESQWGQLTLLFSQVDELLQEVSQRREKGMCCAYEEETDA